jgi:type II secretion system protein N
MFFRMLRLTRMVVWLVAALLACFAAALLGMNLYVQSQGTQARLQQELSQRLGMPLRIERLSVMPWAGLKLSGITIPETGQPNAPLFLEAKSFRLRVKFSSIFRRPLVVKDVTLYAPKVVWPQSEAGKWRLPTFARAQPPLTSPTLATPTTEFPQKGGPGTTAPSSDAQPAPTPIIRQPLEGSAQIKRVRLVDGSFHFLDRARRNVALFDGVQFSSTLRNSESIRGDARIAKIALRDRFFLAALRSPFRYVPAGLQLATITAQSAQGELSGSFSMQPQKKDSPFTVRANFHDVHADEVLSKAGGPKEIVQGLLEGSFELAGKTADAGSAVGAGTLILRGGHVQQFAVLAALGQLLQIEELTELDLQEAEAKYHVADGRILIDEMILRSPNLRLNATGSVTFNGKLALESTLAINDKIRAQLFRAIRENFTPTEEPGLYALSFHIGGTLDKPRTNLMERAVGTQIRDLGGVVDALLGRGKGKKKKKLEAPPPSATPSASALP